MIFAVDAFVNAQRRRGDSFRKNLFRFLPDFENKQGVSVLSFGFPYREAPKSYIRKLTLAPAVTAYQHLKKGETIFVDVANS